jgi:chitin disaccharide deacetylase
MPARLILNADDFGLTRGINRAIAELHTAGALTSATLMANGPAFEDAVTITRTHPTLGIGCHIVLTNGTPISPPEQIPSLLGPDRKTFHPSLPAFLYALLRNQIREDEVLLEARAQIQKLQSAGIPITHIDTHKHTHLFPTITRPLLAACEAASIPAIRNPFEPAWSRSLNQGSLPRRLALTLISRLRARFESHPQIRSHRILTTEGTLAISATGQLNAHTLAQILAALPPTGTYELCCHPGYNDSDLNRITTRLRTHRNTEREALVTEIPRLLAQPSPPTLINYAALTAAQS